MGLTHLCINRWHFEGWVMEPPEPITASRPITNVRLTDRDPALGRRQSSEPRQTYIRATGFDSFAEALASFQPGERVQISGNFVNPRSKRYFTVYPIVTDYRRDLVGPRERPLNLWLFEGTASKAPNRKVRERDDLRYVSAGFWQPGFRKVDLGHIRRAPPVMINTFAIDGTVAAQQLLEYEKDDDCFLAGRFLGTGKRKSSPRLAVERIFPISKERMDKMAWRRREGEVEAPRDMLVGLLDL